MYENMSIELEKEWEYKSMDCARYVVDVDDLGVPLKIRVENGNQSVCRQQPIPVAKKPLRPSDNSFDREAWFYGSKRVGMNGDYFGGAVRVQEEVDPDSEKIATKLTVETHGDTSYTSEIDVVFWGHDLDVGQGDRLYISAMNFKKFKGEMYISVPDSATVRVLDSTETVEDIRETVEKAKKFAIEEFEATHDEVQEGLDSFA